MLQTQRGLTLKEPRLVATGIRGVGRCREWDYSTDDGVGLEHFWKEGRVMNPIVVSMAK